MNSTTDASMDQAKRTWFRTLFEAQAAAYSPSGPGQSAIGYVPTSDAKWETLLTERSWFYWSWQTQYDIDAWSYRKGLDLGYIPKNVSDPSTYVFPIGSDGCIDRTFNYTAPPLSSSTSSPTSTHTNTATGTLAGQNATGTTSPSGSKGSASALGPKTASRLVSEYGLTIWMGIFAISLLSVVV